jgi:hypothetical protein
MPRPVKGKIDLDVRDSVPVVFDVADETYLHAETRLAALMTSD